MENGGNKLEGGSDKESVEFQPRAISAGDRIRTSPSPTSGVSGMSHVLNFKPVLVSKFTFPRNRMETLGVTYNSKSRRLIVLDNMGCVSWSVNPVGAGRRELEFPKQMYGILRQIIYCSKFNVYFALAKDYSLKVYNKDFCETFVVLNSDLKVVKSIIFNPRTNELITGGVGGVKFWKYKVNPKSMSKIMAMSNYELFLRADYPHMGGNWVKKVELDVGGQLVFCCSIQALFCYNTEGKLLLEIPHPHTSSPTACLYSPHDKSLLTCSGGCEVNQWTGKGTLAHRFTGHSRAVTNLLLHPETSCLFISSSRDGTVRVWSLDTLSQLLSLPVLEEGIEWMGLTETDLLYCCSNRRCLSYSLNYFTHFWSHLGSSVTHLSITSARRKTARVSVLQQENSLYIMSQRQGMKLSVVLPLPTNTLVDYVYNRARNLVFYLLDPAQIWIYTIKTNPACRVSVWNVPELLKNTCTLNGGRQSGRISVAEDMRLSPFDGSLWKVPISACCCIASLSSPIYYPTGEGLGCADSEELLLLGLEDGRMLFMDAGVDWAFYHEVQAHKGPVILIKQTMEHQLTCVGRDPAGKCLKIWSLPHLDLLREVPVPQSTVSLSTIGSHLCLGLESGSIVFSNVGATDSEPLPPSVTRLQDKESELEKKQGTYLSNKVFTDACPQQNIFLSYSGDEVMKIWDTRGYLLTEVVLDQTLTYAIFLNNKGDVLMGFKDHLFLIPHQKLMFDVADATSVTSAKESDIYEDPSIRYEFEGIGQQEAEGHLDMDSYLAPFKSRHALLGSKEVRNTSESGLSSGEDYTMSRQSSMSSINQAGSLATEASPGSSLQPVKVSQHRLGPHILEPETDRKETSSRNVTSSEHIISPPSLEFQSSAETVDFLQENSLEPPLLGMGNMPQSPSTDGTSAISDSENQLPTEDLSLQGSRGPSSGDLKKQLHPSPATLTINWPHLPPEVNLADRNELARRGLKLDRFFTANQQLTQAAFQLNLELKQPLFLNIYENELILRRKQGKKYKKGQKSRIKIPEYFQGSKKRTPDSDKAASPERSEDEVWKRLRR